MAIEMFRLKEIQQLIETIDTGMAQRKEHSMLYPMFST